MPTSLKRFLVCDANVVLRHLLHNPERDYYKQLWLGWMADEIQIYAPSLWLDEVISGISKAVYFKSITTEYAAELASIVHQLPIELVVPTESVSQKALVWTQKMKRKNAYDSIYVALAEEMGCALWTADKKLFNAINQPWVKWAGST